MKLRQLTIHNIASIEDAHIDFDAAPLRDSDVFLITGRTGAGKSTLLDAICLALYNTTPRLQGNCMDGTMSGEDANIQLKDAAHLLRRNTGEGHVRLTFTGNNGVEYTSLWSVRRARNKATGKLQPKQRHLSFRKGGKECELTRNGDIDAEILEAVGLSFTQFCRTTMLAQGEFTKFLNSHDADKAAILERITNAYAYSEIGSMVFAITRRKEEEYREAVRRRGDIKLLTDKELEDIETETGAVCHSLQQAARTRAQLEAKLRWLRTDSELTVRLSALDKEYQDTLAIIAGDEFKSQSQCVADWQQTDHARTLMRDIANASRQRVEAEKHLHELRNEYRTLTAGLRYLSDSIATSAARREAIAADIATLSPKAAIFASYKAVTTTVNRMQTLRRDIEKATAGINAYLTERDATLKPRLLSLDNSRVAANEAYDKARKAADKLAEDFTACDLTDLNRRHKAIMDKLACLIAARTLIDALDGATARHRQFTEELATKAAALDTLHRKREPLSARVETARTICNATLEVYNSHKETVDEWARAIRAHLHAGDICPVCRQRLTAALPSEESLDSLYIKAEHAYDEAAKSLESLKDELANLDADIKVRQQQLDIDTRRMQTDRTVEEARTKAASACATLGITELDADTVRQLDELDARLNADAATLQRQIASAQEMGRQLEKARRDENKTLKQLNMTTETLQTATKEMDRLEAENNTRRQLTVALESNLSATCDELKSTLGDTVWMYQPDTHPAEFMQQLTAECSRYNELTAEAAVLDNRLRDDRTILTAVEGLLAETVAACPEWAGRVPPEPAEAPNLPGRCNALNAARLSQSELRNAARRTIRECSQALDNFISENPRYSIEYISSLNEIPAETIRDMDSKLHGLLDRHNDAAARLRQLQAEFDTHRKAPEQPGEGESAGTLTEALDTVKEQADNANRRLGELRHTLKVNESHRKDLADLLRVTQEREIEYNSWSRLNTLIGDATGSKFRKIAQSLVLADLIRSANNYMRTLSDRYTLYVEPGSFLILIEDAYQGYARRPSSTISGGESFLVSLSLALALSDISTGLRTDTLFIDEGFGTLSGQPLQDAINTLRTLHARAGRHVGIISHVEELRERIPVQILVSQPANSSASTVTVAEV